MLTTPRLTKLTYLIPITQGPSPRFKHSKNQLITHRAWFKHKHKNKQHKQSPHN